MAPAPEREDQRNVPLPRKRGASVRVASGVTIHDEESRQRPGAAA